MKVLFVCLGNTARSQMAAALYNRLTGHSDAFSAGIHVEHPGQTLLQRRREHPGQSFVVDVMHDAGIDIGANVSTQLTRDMLAEYDLIVNMAAKRFTPNWVSAAPNYEYWKVRDPKGRSYRVTASAEAVIEQKVRRLLEDQKLSVLPTCRRGQLVR